MMRTNKWIALGIVFLFSASLYSAPDYSSPEKTLIAAMSYVQSQKWEELYSCLTYETTERIEYLTKTYLFMILFFAKKKIENKDALTKELMSLTGKAYFVRLLQYAYWNEPRAFAFEEMTFGNTVYDDNEVFIKLELVDKRDKKRKEKIYFKKVGSQFLGDLTPLIKKYDRR